MCAVPNMAVFCSSLISWLPGMLLTYFLNDFEMVPVARIITGITFVVVVVVIVIVIIIIIVLFLMCLYVCPSARNNSTPSIWIFIKSDICGKSVEKIQVPLKSDKINGTLYEYLRAR